MASHIHHPPEDSDLLLARAIWPDASPEDVRALNAWIGADPERASLVAWMRRACHVLPAAVARHRADAAWDRARVRLALSVNDRDSECASTAQPWLSARQRRKSFSGQSQSSSVFTAHSLRRQMWSAAAAVGLGLLVLALGWAAGMRHTSRRAAQASLIYATGNGERATITLPDGGTVALNVASRLEVPADYMANNHTIRLVGQGLFTVSHHDGTPLTVLAGGTITRVLGTSFVVRHYATDTTTLVAVRDGKVAVDSLVVTAAHLVEMGRMGIPRVRPSDASPFTFTTGVLSIDGLPLPAAIVELDRWYDVDIRLGDPILRTQYMRGRYATGSPGDLAEILEGTFNVHLVRDGRVLTLFPR